jgi:hypothetical protein
MLYPPFNKNPAPIVACIEDEPIIVLDAVIAAAARVPVIVGDVENTTFPAVPVSSVRKFAKFADVGVPKKVIPPVPNPVIPVASGNCVAFVKVPEDGVPKAPPLTTNAPALPVLTPSAVITPVPVVTLPIDDVPVH